MGVKGLNNSSGIAVIEILPLLVVFISLIGMTLGLWGAVHTGTLQSIAARHYAFEIINNRTHINHHRDYPFSSGRMEMLKNTEDSNPESFYPPSFGTRFFGIAALQLGGNPYPFVANRGINFFKEKKREDSENTTGGSFNFIKETDKPSFHQDLFTAKIKELPRNQRGVNPIWLMQGYGICISHFCGD